MEEKQPQRLNKNKIFLILGVAAAILIVCAFIFLRKSDPTAPGSQKPRIKDSTLVKKNDSLVKPKDSIDNNGAEGEEESPIPNIRSLPIQCLFHPVNSISVIRYL